MRGLGVGVYFFGSSADSSQGGEVQGQFANVGGWDFLLDRVFRELQPFSVVPSDNNVARVSGQNPCGFEYNPIDGRASDQDCLNSQNHRSAGKRKLIRYTILALYLARKGICDFFRCRVEPKDRSHEVCA